MEAVLSLEIPGEACPGPLDVISNSSTVGKIDYSVPRNMGLGPG